MIPRYIALCGKPEAGKSTVQDMLTRFYGVKPIDDGRVLRDAAIALFGLSEWHVTTLEGKRSLVTVCGKRVEVRELLGWIGNVMEDRFGTQFTPEAALRTAEVQGLGEAPAFSFGSVRKNQGLTYRRVGGIVVEVTNPRVADSIYAFDKYDRSLITHSIDNSGSIVELESKVRATFDPIFS